MFRRVGTSKDLIQAFTNIQKFKAYTKLNITRMFLNLLNWFFYLGHHNNWNRVLMTFAYIIQIIFSFWAILALKYESKKYMQIYIGLISISTVVVPCIMVEEYWDNNWDLFGKLGYDFWTFSDTIIVVVTQIFASIISIIYSQKCMQSFGKGLKYVLNLKLQREITKGNIRDLLL